MRKLPILLFIAIILLVSLVVAQDIVSPEGGITVSKINWGLLRLILFAILPIAVLIIAAILLKNKLREKLWLKWDLILEIFLISQAISVLICSKTLSCSGEWCGIECILPIVPQFYLSILLDSNIIIAFLISTVIYFIIGALIGLIIQKVRKK